MGARGTHAARAARSCHRRLQKFGVFLLPFGWVYYAAALCSEKEPVQVTDVDVAHTLCDAQPTAVAGRLCAAYRARAAAALTRFHRVHAGAGGDRNSWQSRPKRGLGAANAGLLWSDVTDQAPESQAHGR